MGAYKITLTAAVVIMALGLVLFQLLPEQMLMLFVDKSDAAAAQEMIEVGVPALKTISCPSSVQRSVSLIPQCFRQPHAA